MKREINPTNYWDYSKCPCGKPTARIQWTGRTKRKDTDWPIYAHGIPGIRRCETLPDDQAGPEGDVAYYFAGVWVCGAGASKCRAAVAAGRRPPMAHHDLVEESRRARAEIRSPGRRDRREIA